MGSLLALVLLVLAPSTLSSPLIRGGGNQNQETEKLSIRAPGVDVEVGGGGVSVVAPGARIHTGRRRHECNTVDLPAARTVWNNEDCQNVLPDYYLNTTEDTYGSLTDEDRVATMDNLCSSACGDIYTAYLKMSRSELGCATMQQQVERQSEGQDQGEGEEGEDSSGDGNRLLLRLPVEERKDDDEGFGISVNVNGRERYRPDDDYPGLLLGCIKDPVDGVYCATKKGDWSDGDCDFFLSCCYGEYLAGQGTQGFINRVEQKCPGSANYTNVACSSNHTLTSPTAL